MEEQEELKREFHQAVGEEGEEGEAEGEEGEAEEGGENLLTVRKKGKQER